MGIPEYRPCVITKSCNGTRSLDNESNCNHRKRYQKALFHFWTEHHQYYNNVNGYGAYIQPSHIIQPVAIVEYEDGTVHEVLPREIRFMDGKMREYCFERSE